MGDLWCEFATRNPAPKELWGTYSDTGEPKGVLHTTEVFVFRPALKTYYGHTSYPHFTLLPDMDEKTTKLYQHIPTNRAARALRSPAPGVPTNRDNVVQVEICWQASIGHAMPEWMLQDLRKLMRWCEDTNGIPSVAIDDFHYYLPEGGHRLGQEPWRLSDHQYDIFSGWLGHQHVPRNTHGDAGKLPIRKLLRVTLTQLEREAQPMMDKYNPAPIWPNGRETFVEVDRNGVVVIHNDVSALDGKSDWHKGDMRDVLGGRKPAPGAHIIGVKTHGTVDEGYSLYAADSSTFRFV